MARIVSCFTLQVSVKKGGPSQILKRPITKLIVLVENEFDSSSDGAITKWTKRELFFGEPDVMV